MKPTVLCVDDLESVLNNYNTRLSEDYNVVTATTGAEALAYIREHPVDAVLMDRDLGRDDGIEVIKKMRQLGVTVPIAICSDYISDVSVILASEAGATSYVGKNCYIPFLKEHLSGHLDNS